MLISKEVEIKIGHKNIRHYHNLGYSSVNGETLFVKIKDLLPTTKVNIIAQCDFCYSEIKTTYKNYHRNFNSHIPNMFSCSPKCTNLKSRTSNLEKYGVEFPNQSQIIKSKTKQNSISNCKRYDPNLVLDRPDWMDGVITDEVMITINKWNINHLTELGYTDLKQNDKWIIPVGHLMMGSAVRIECRCSICKSVNTIQFCKYVMNYQRSKFYSCKNCNNTTYKMSMMYKYGVDNSSKNPESIKKSKKTCLDKYGSEFAICSQHSRKKSKETFLERYGVEHPMKLDEFKYKGVDAATETKIKNGFVVSPEKLTEWEKYRREVRKLTERNRNDLLVMWDGTDYYDGENIKENYLLSHIDPKFPTLDHKISIMSGFKNNMDHKDISDISNLCITKRSNNSSKSFLDEEEFMKYLKEQTH